MPTSAGLEIWRLASLQTLAKIGWLALQKAWRNSQLNYAFTTFVWGFPVQVDVWYKNS